MLTSHARIARLLAVLFVLVTPVAADPYVQQAIDREVRVAAKLAPNAGVHVVDLDTGETVYAWNPDEQRIVASNTKLFTTAAALDAFGPGYFHETRLVARGEVRGGVLEGDLGVVGDGDPNISGRHYDGDPYAVFRQWARALAERGVKRVAGDIYLDHGLFAPPEVHPDWPRDQLTSWYEAPVDALSFSDNCVLVRVWPGRQAGRPALVETVPPAPVFSVVNNATTSAERRRHHVNVARQGNVLTVSGRMWQGSGPLETWVTVPDPAEYFGLALEDALAEEGIEVTGRPHKVERLPGDVWERVAVHRTDLLTSVMVTNKRSQNFYAESLLKLLAAKRCGEGSWREGVRAVEEFLETVGIPRGSYKMADGSGMSRGNRFTPRQVTRLLRHMFFHPTGREFAQSMPYGGEEVGSWDKRLATPPYRGNVFAKTGTLSDVSALSGYAKAVSGKAYAFSILCNRAGVADAKRFQDRIVMALVDNG